MRGQPEGRRQSHESQPYHVLGIGNPAPLVEPSGPTRETAGVRCWPTAALLALCACSAPDRPREEPVGAPVPEPQVQVAVRLPEGTRLRAQVVDGLPDDASWRAVGTWWREALAQTRRFSVAPSGAPAATTVVLTVDAEAQALTATLRRIDEERLLAVSRFGPGSETPGLLASLDHLAWSARRALGEAAARPMAVARATSADPRVVTAVEDAEGLVRTGAFGSAYDALKAARRRDGGAPFVLAPLAALDLLRGDARRARDVCREAVGYAARCSPTVQHRLARTLLLANAALEPEQAGDVDRELQRLATVARRERPHDDAPRYTEALAANFLADFERARPQLEELRRRLPEHGFVAYHLGWACLGTSDPRAAAEHLAEAASRLPLPWVVLPWAIALYESAQHDALRRLLERARRGAGASGLEHQVLRMMAAHALLRGERARARGLLLDDLRWLVQHPLELDRRAGDFADAGAVLVRLGSAPELRSLVAAVQKLPVEGATRDAAAFVGGLEQVRATGRRAVRLEESLGRDGDSPWSALLAAYAHEREGEVGAMQQALARAALLSSSPLTKALLARSLRAVGKAREADLLQRTLAREMQTLNLRGRCQHPLFGPELAFAVGLR